LPLARFVARKTHFHFTTQQRFSGAVFASKTDFSQPASQPLQTLCGCPLPRQTACSSRSTGQSFARTSPMRSRQHLQKHFAGNATCRAADTMPVKPQFHAQLGMCQPALAISRLAAQLALSLTSLRGAHSLLALPKPPAPTRLPLHTFNIAKRAAALPPANEP